MEPTRIDIDDVKSVLTKVGVDSKEYHQCLRWPFPEMEIPLKRGDAVIAELTVEEQGFLRCIGYVHEEKVTDTLRLKALRETFWSTIRSLHNLPTSPLAIKEAKYIVTI